MCAACLTTAALAVAGGTSAGAKRLRRMTGAKPGSPITATKGAQEC